MSKIKIKKTFSKVLLLILSAEFLITTSFTANVNSAEIVTTENDASEYEVLAGGIPFGVKFFTEGIKIIGFTSVDTEAENKSPAYNAGLRENDIIMNINCVPVGKSEDFIKTVEECNGNPLAVDYKRSGKIFSAVITPVISKTDGKYKTGMWIKDSTAGIGTLTYIIPETKAFAGLGHSICDGTSGDILKFNGGIITSVTINSVSLGKKGTPGELKGTFAPEKIGTIKKNCDVGVFGIYSKLPEAAAQCKIMKIANEKEITNGPAKMMCTIDESGIKEYDIIISETDFSEPSNKNYVIQVCDPELIGKTGGIVQGMSGSPIIQSGKLIGAVTHVFINDPTKGYGIYIKKMLSETN